jgi:hypothetical protein
MFSILKPKITLDLYTWRREIYDTAQPSKSNDFYPAWWKTLEKTKTPQNAIRPIPTMKVCTGFIDQYSAGIVVPMWSDCNIELPPKGNSDFRWDYADNISEAVPHPGWQRGTFLPDHEFAHLKLVSPWLGFCSTDVKWQLLQCAWNTERPHDIIVPPGMLDFKYQNAININAFLRKTDAMRIEEIKFGQPMIQLVPLTEREVKVQCHLISREEWADRNAYGRSVTFVGNYKIHKNAALKKQSGKCPFSGA